MRACHLVLSWNLSRLLLDYPRIGVEMLRGLKDYLGALIFAILYFRHLTRAVNLKMAKVKVKFSMLGVARFYFFHAQYSCNLPTIVVGVDALCHTCD